MATIAASASRSKKEKTNVSKFTDLIIKGALIGLVFILPIFFLPYTFEGLEFNKQNLLIVLTLVAVVAWLGKVISHGRLDLKKNILNMPLIVFVAVYALASFFSLSKYQSFIGAGTQQLYGFVTVLCFVLLYLVIVNTFESVKNIRFMLRAGLFSSFIVGLHGLLQFLGIYILPFAMTKSKVFNMIGTVNGFGVFCALILTIVIAYLISIYINDEVKNKDNIKDLALKIFLWVLGGVMMINIVIIDFWVIWVALLIAMILVLVFSFSRTATLNTKWLMLPMIILVVSVLFQFVNLPLGLGLPSEVSPNFRSSWQIAKGSLQENPLFGSGPGTFLADYTKYKPESINNTAFWNIRFDRAVSEFFTMLATMGVIGVVSWLIVVGAFLYFVVSRFIKSKSNANWLLGIGLLGGFVFLLVSKFIYTSNLTLEFYFWILFALLAFFVSGETEKRSFSLETSPKMALLLSFAFIIVLTFSASGIYLIGQRYAAEIYYKQGVEMNQSMPEQFVEINKKMQRAIQLNKYRDLYYRNLARLYADELDRQAQSLMTAEEQQKIEITKNVQLLIDGAINFSKSATIRGEKNVANWNVLGDIYQQIAPIVPRADEFASESYERAIELEPSNPVLYTQLAKVYLLKYDMIQQALKAEGGDQRSDKAELERQAIEVLDQAQEKLTKAIELKANYAAAHYQLALLHVRKGDTDSAIKELETNRLVNSRDVALGLQLAILYYQNDQKDKSVAELERIIALAPNYSNALWYLASVYEDQGKQAEAIKIIERVKELNPDNEIVDQRLSDLRAGKTTTSSEELPEPVDPEPEEGMIPVPVEEISVQSPDDDASVSEDND